MSLQKVLIWIIILLLVVVSIMGILKYFNKSSSEGPINSQEPESVIDCNSLNEGSEKDNCFFNLAKTQKKPDICRNVIDTPLRGDCYLILESQ